MKEPSKTVHFVSLGPGDPDLMTLKAHKTLHESDVIFCPATKGRNGSTVSRSASIVCSAGIEEGKIRTFEVPMCKDRSRVKKIYDETAEAIIAYSNQGKAISVVAEGDAGFYTSIQYMFNKIQDSGITTKRIAGIPAFIAAGAAAGIHIAKLDESLTVVSKLHSEEELSGILSHSENAVIMKLPLSADVLRHFISLHKEFDYHYFENLGTEEEYYTHEPADIIRRDFPYFSLMIIRHKDVYTE